ncbi:MAG: hypothetical protein COA45_01705 [Zetaproteobacteria bacterium]|nr:MAG: hypothetical protein COA45_01705 [Zetaproteobacteria bacterium]
MKLNRFIDSLSIKAGLLAALALGGCIATTLPYMRAETAQRIASPAWMIKRDIAAAPYLLRSYERIHDRGGVANLYIAGDGPVNVDAPEGPVDSTPENPVALHLASKDRADNVIFIARPCQYTAMLSKGDVCDDSISRGKRFSAEVIASFDKALNDIAARYDIRGFNLIGYSGGAAIATLLATKRKDILSIRTVAGILDHEVHSKISGAPVLDGSLNPVKEASALTRVPQYHFIGGQDKYVLPAVLHSYLQAMPPTNCVQTMLVQEASYDTGWVDKWPELLELPVTCYNAAPPSDLGEITPPASPKEPFFTVREKPLKP